MVGKLVAQQLDELSVELKMVQCMLHGKYG